jgi:hypothetical protein
MAKQESPAKRRISAIINIIAGLLALGAGFNILGATPGSSWVWLLLAVAFIAAGVWGLIR